MSSEDYIVSARKYRPLRFSDVIGQEHITQTLENEIKSHKLAQAFLFCGPRGVGKTTCARILAREINEESIDRKDYDYSFNIFELDAASNNSVDDIRELNAQVRIPPQIGKYKVYIIDEVHMLSASAFNAFLKTLEEPPPYAVFILATTEKHKILPTILSRCQVFNFYRIEVKEMVGHLKEICVKEAIEAEEDALHLIAQKSDGALRDALSIFDQMVSYAKGDKITFNLVLDNLNVLDYDYFFRLTDAFVQKDLNKSLLIYNEIMEAGFDGQIFLSGISSHFRDLMVARDPSTISLLDVSDTMKKRYTDACQDISDSFLLNAINIANEYDLNYKASNNHRLHVEIALMKMAHIQSLIELVEKKKPEPTDQSPAVEPITPESSPPDAVVAEASQDTEQATEQRGEQDILQPVQEKPQEVAAEGLDASTESDRIEPKEEGAGTISKFNLPKKKNRKGTLKVNISEILQSDGAEEKPKEEEPVLEEKIVEVPDSVELSEADVLEAYLSYQNAMVAEERKSIESVLKLNTPRLEGNKIIIHLNKNHKTQLEEVRTDLLIHIRKFLKNRDVILELVETEKTIEQRVPYTDREKFEAMCKKNPSLRELANKLKLDVT
jgi:DNA polymerase III subunit gamma/tau